MSNWILCLTLVYISCLRFRSQTAIYAAGAGLGSSKGREIGKFQDGYTSYVQMAKDVVRILYLSICRITVDLLMLSIFRPESGMKDDPQKHAVFQFASGNLFLVYPLPAICLSLSQTSVMHIN